MRACAAGDPTVTIMVKTVKVLMKIFVNFFHLKIWGDKNREMQHEWCGPAPVLQRCTAPVLQSCAAPVLQSCTAPLP